MNIHAVCIRTGSTTNQGCGLELCACDVLREQGCAILADISKNEELCIYTSGYVKPIFELIIQCQCELKRTD